MSARRLSTAVATPKKHIRDMPPKDWLAVMTILGEPKVRVKVVMASTASASSSNGLLMLLRPRPCYGSTSMPAAVFR